MVNKKPNEVTGWKAKLAALDGLPGEEGLDKNSGWQQLHTRLQQKDGRKKAIWFWAAASILLLIGLSVWLMLPNATIMDPKVAVNPPKVTKPEKTTLPTATLLEDKNKTKSTDVLPTTAPIKPLKIKALDSRPLDTVNLAKTTVLPVDTQAVETLAVVKTMPNPADSQITMVKTMALPARKKLKVVHINDLNYPPTTGQRVYTGQDYFVQQIRFPKRPIYSTVSPSTNSIQFTISSNKKISTN